MTRNPHRAGRSFDRLVTSLGASYRLTAQVTGYRVTDIQPGDVEYVDSDWDGSEAEASYPNPSDEDTDLDFLSDHYLFVPETDGDDRPPKSAFKGPLRMGPGGPVNTNALLANLQAINGARGGFDDVSMDTLEAGFDAAVAHLIEAGEYDSADDAPDFSAEAAEHGGDGEGTMTDFSMGDLVQWEDGDADVYGIVRDKATEGDDVFADDIDGDFALSPTEDNPGYLVETLDETEDGWVPSGTMTGHRGETLEPWDPDKDVMDDADARLDITTAQAHGTIRSDSTTNATLTAELAEGDNSLGGIIWGAGDHDLALGGEPTPVRVPEETVRPTFEALKEDIQTGDVTLGFDHPGPDSVAAKTGIVDIGVATEAALTADEEYIALTGSELTNDTAAEAAEAGDFDGLDWSIVADVAVRRDDSGAIVREDGRVVLDATRIKRIDAVDTGAVDAASIERDESALPDLKERTEAIREAAASPTETDDAVHALRVTATAIHNTMTDDNPSIDPTGVDNLSEARNQLSAAADVIDNQQDELEAAEAKASGFTRLLSAHGVELDDYDGDVEAAAQAVIDEQTEDTREEIAELEAELAKFDTEDVAARKSDLTGESPDDLRRMLNERKATAFDAQRKRQTRGKAAAKDDTVGQANAAGGLGNTGGSGDANDIAEAAMDGGDRIEAQAEGKAPAEYIQDKYGLHASDFDSGAELNREIAETTGGN